jgi:hypothetical protein
MREVTGELNCGGLLDLYPVNNWYEDISCIYYFICLNNERGGRPEDCEGEPEPILWNAFDENLYKSLDFGKFSLYSTTF